MNTPLNIKTKVCSSRNKQDKTTKSRKVKENGAIGYYDIDVVWCDKCTKSHNYYLMASW